MGLLTYSGKGQPVRAFRVLLLERSRHEEAQYNEEYCPAGNANEMSRRPIIVNQR